MNRRDALRMLAAGAVIPALTPELFAFYRRAHPEGSYSLRTLSPRQNDTVVAMIDQIIPATDTPGAKGARVNEFIDVILTEWAKDDERRNFLDGLADVDKQSNALFGKDFAFEGILVAPHESVEEVPGFRSMGAGHPIPDEGSIAAARAIVDLLSRCDAHTLIFFLLSGGGSSLR